MAMRGAEKSFAPLVPPAPAALLLGSYPSPLSFEQQFYYGHPRNRFWPLVAALGGQAAPRTVEEKKALILKSRLALWDVLESCTIRGADDASIEDPVVNDIAGLVKRHNIQAVFCNGAASHRLYQRHCQPLTGLAAHRLPSTSPANAGYSLERLLAAWQPLAVYLSPFSAPPAGGKL